MCVRDDMRFVRVCQLTLSFVLFVRGGVRVEAQGRKLGGCAENVWCIDARWLVLMCAQSDFCAQIELLQVFASPSMRQMDGKADKTVLTYPYLFFTIENFDDVFSSTVVLERECLCIELIARVRGGREADAGRSVSDVF